MAKLGFPSELLTQPIQNKIEYFKNFTLVHPHLKQTYDDLLNSIKYSTPGSLIFLYGPSGVGKTTLIQKAYKDFFDLVYIEMLANPSKLPAVLVRAIATDGGMFDWKDYFKRLLLASNDFISDRTVNDKRWENIIYQNNKILNKENTSSSIYRKAVENSLRYRNPAALFVDEAQEIGAVATGRKLLRQTNVLKSIAEETKINHVLCGTYELLPLRNLNGQLSRRSIEIHFPRYDAHDSDQSMMFRTVLRTFEKFIPLPEPPDLVNYWEYIFERSIGCIGTVKDWLIRSLSWSLEQNKQTLTLSDLQKREPSIAQSKRSLEEILEGEKNLKNEKQEVDKLRFKLGLST